MTPTVLFSRTGLIWMRQVISKPFPEQAKQISQAFLPQAMYRIKFTARLLLPPAAVVWLHWTQNGIWVNWERLSYISRKLAKYTKERKRGQALTKCVRPVLKVQYGAN